MFHGQMAEDRQLVGFRADAETKAWLELLAKAGGYSSTSAYLEDLALREIDAIDAASKQALLKLREQVKARVPKRKRRRRAEEKAA